MIGLTQRIVWALSVFGALALCAIGTEAAEKRNIQVSGKIVSVDLENNSVVVLVKGERRNIEWTDSTRLLVRYKVGLEDLPTDRLVVAVGKVSPDKTQIAAQTLRAPFIGAKYGPEILDKRVSGYLERSDTGEVALNVKGARVKVKTTRNTQFHRYEQRTFDQLKVGETLIAQAEQRGDKVSYYQLTILRDKPAPQEWRLK